MTSSKLGTTILQATFERLEMLLRIVFVQFTPWSFRSERETVPENKKETRALWAFVCPLIATATTTAASGRTKQAFNLVNQVRKLTRRNGEFRACGPVTAHAAVHGIQSPTTRFRISRGKRKKKKKQTWTSQKTEGGGGFRLGLFLFASR